MEGILTKVGTQVRSKAFPRDIRSRHYNRFDLVSVVHNGTIIIHCFQGGRLSLTLAAQLGKRGITVNAIAPGVTETDMAAWVRKPESQTFIASKTALGRVGQANDIAEIALFLASSESRWITGQYIDASGGFNL